MPHFDYVAGEATKSIALTSQELGALITLKLLTIESIEQTIERAATKAGNKGVDAAMSVIEMVNLLDPVGPSPMTNGNQQSPVPDE